MGIAAPYPVFLDLEQRPVLIVGGGGVALRKARGLVAAWARVTVVSPEFAEGFAEIKEIDRITAPYAATHMSKRMWRLVFAATNVRAVNDVVQKHAAAHGILCCRCDEPDLGDFSGGATWQSEQGHVTVAVATAGASPVLAVRLRDAAAGAVDPVLIAWAALMGPWRRRAKQEICDLALRRELFTRMASEPMELCLRSEGAAAANALFDRWLGELRAAPGSTESPATRTSENAE
jgi:siroheme synthase-like protein